MSPKAGSEVIPDSEDERSKGQGKLPVVTRKIPQVVEISSDEENGPPKASSSKVQIPKVVPVTPKSNRTIRYVHAHKPVSVSSSDSEEEENKNGQPIKEEDALLYSPIKASHTREVIDLTTTCYEEEKAEEDEVFDELIFGDEDWLKKKTVGLVQLPPKLKLKGAIPLSNFPEEDELWNDDGESVTSDEPKLTARTTPNPPQGSSSPTKLRQPEPDTISLLSSDNSDTGEGAITRIADPTPCPLDGPSSSMPVPENRRRVMQSSPSISSVGDSAVAEGSTKEPPAVAPSTKKPRMTKKVKLAIEQTRREKYAQDLFDELNRVVFKSGLPEDTALKWSNRLLTTAGRAKWKRSRDGSQTSEIELATKILDCDERIRNTLSHEMCHLACWIIDGDPKEGHGKAFKSWAAKIMRRRSDIQVTTRHSYEINYPYEWECENCAKIYGRYSKSIRPDECRCGACKVGVLVPLFKVRAPQTPQKTKADSRLAAISSRDSPRTISAIAESFTELKIQDEDVASTLNLMKGMARPAVRNDIFGLSRPTIDAQLSALTKELGGIGLLGEP